MRLEDFKGADAVELLADVMVPLSHIYSDDNIKKMWKEGKKTIAEVASYALKTHKVYVLDIYEAMTGEKRNKATPIKIIQLMLEISNDPELKDLFLMQGQENEPSTSSGSATENTEDGDN